MRRIALTATSPAVGGTGPSGMESRRYEAGM